MIAAVSLVTAAAVWFVLAGEPDPRRLGRPEGRWRGVLAFIRGRPDAPRLPKRLAGSGVVAVLVWVFAGDLPTLVRLALVVLIGGGILLGWGWMEPASSVRDRERQRHQLPGAIDLLASALAAGVAPRTAAAEVARVMPEPTRSALLAVTAETDVGRSDAEAWRMLGESRRWQEVWGRVARDLARSASTGVPVEEVLRVHAQRARQERRAALERSARAVGVSSVVPLMVCYLPAFMAVGVAPIVLGLGLRYLP